LRLEQACSYFVLTVDCKDQLSNVAFGGAWSEQLAEDYELNSMMAVLQKAAIECADRDVNNKDLMMALR